MTCFLPFLSGILPRSADDKLLVDVRGDGVDTTEQPSGSMPGGFLGWFSGGGAKSSSAQGPSDQASEEKEEEGPYESYYRIWYGKGLIGFKPKSLGGTGAILPLARRFDELDDSCSAANGVATSSETTGSPDSIGSPSKSGHDWSKQSLVVSQSQTEGRSLHNYWEERSHTTTMATPESVSSPLKAVPVAL